MNHELTIYDEPSEDILERGKVVEGRAGTQTGKYSELEAGDTIDFFNTEEEYLFSVGVEEVNHYKSVKEMLENEGLQRCLPRKDNIKDGVSTYHSISNYKERIEKYGIYAIVISSLETVD